MQQGCYVRQQLHVNVGMVERLLAGDDFKLTGVLVTLTRLRGGPLLSGCRRLGSPQRKSSLSKKGIKKRTGASFGASWICLLGQSSATWCDSQKKMDSLKPSTDRLLASPCVLLLTLAICQFSLLKTVVSLRVLWVRILPPPPTLVE